jgi:tetratricopeptide (TPR) repeat protein
VNVADGRIDELRRRMERDPRSRLFAQLAEELRKAGEVEEAVSVARAGLERHPHYPSARLTLGRALLDSGDPAAAKTELETAVREAPDNILACRLLGETLETLGDLGGALAALGKTLEMAPGDPQVEARMRAIRERLGGAPAASPAGRAPEVTKPMAPVPAAPPEARAEAEAGGLPPTVRIRMAGEDQPAPRAPLPPTEAPPRRPEPDPGPPPPGATPGLALDDSLPPTLPLGARTNALEVQKAAAAAAEGPEIAPNEGEGSDAEGPVRGGTAPGARAAAEGSTPGDAGGESGQAPLSSATLAELYFKQGLLARAVEVYRQVLEEEPANEGARRRLEEIEATLKATGAEPPDGGGEAEADPAARRRVLERTIERLEELLAVVRQARTG